MKHTHVFQSSEPTAVCIVNEEPDKIVVMLHYSAQNDLGDGRALIKWLGQIAKRYAKDARPIVFVNQLRIASASETAEFMAGIAKKVLGAPI